MIKMIAAVGAALNFDRSKAVRWMLERSLESGQVIALLWSRSGRRLSDEIAGAVMAEQKAGWAAEHASSAAPVAKPHAEIKALRAAEEAEGRLSVLTDRAALKQALKPSDRVK
jgi:hypothetical protein